MTSPFARFLAVALALAACGDADKTDDTGAEACPDLDGDGYCIDDDCDDGDASIHPGATETCDGVDHDCDGDASDGAEYWPDADGDGFGDPDLATGLCEAEDGYVLPGDEDCNDGSADVHPGAEEACNSIDDDCDHEIDEGFSYDIYYRDFDRDGYGDEDEPATMCELATGYVDNGDDCNDADAGEPVHVDASAPESGATGSGDHPFPTIQEGIDASQDCVFVAAGTYNEDIDFGGRSIRVYGRGGAVVTVIHGTGEGPVVTFDRGEDDSTLLQGFTITGGGGLVTEESTDSSCSSGTCRSTTRTFTGGGVYVDGSSPTLDDLILFGNTLPEYSYARDSAGDETYVLSFGGGLYVNHGEVSLRRLVIAANFADAGGGIYLGPGAILTAHQSIVDGNSASSGAGMAIEGSFTATNVIFVNNSTVLSSSGGFGGAAIDLATGDATLNHVTAVGNDGISALLVGGEAAATILCSILYDNDLGPLVDTASGGTVTIEYSDVYLGAPGAYGTGVSDPTGSAGCLSEDPEFVSWSDDDRHGNDDLHLNAGSPALGSCSAEMGAYGGPGGGW